MSSSSSSSKPTASGDLRQRRSGHGGETRKTVDHQNNGRTGPETPKHEPHKVDKDSDDFSVVQQYPESFVDDEPDRFWLIYWDACGIFCFLFGEAVVWFAHYVTITKVVIPMLFQANRWPFWTLILVNGICFQIAVIFLTIAHFRAMLTNPGTVKQNTAAASEINPDPELRERLAEQQTSEAMKTVYRELTMRYCERCRAIKPPRAHHCSVAQRCIIRMDHNCPWVNNTVGQNNYKYFVLFILYVFIGCSVSVFLTSLRGWWCWKIGPCSFYTTGEMVMMIVSAILALFFAIFVATMAYDQFEGLTTDTSGVEAMKMWLEKDIPVSKGLEHYMGCKFGLSWLLPIQPENPAIYRWTPKDKEPNFDRRDPRVRKFATQRIQQKRRREEAIQQGRDLELEVDDDDDDTDDTCLTDDTDEDVPTQAMRFDTANMPTGGSIQHILRRQIHKGNNDGLVAEVDFTK